MFDIGMTELLLIGIVALIVVGPKDLPGMFRTLGRATAKARSLGREFSKAMNEAADESGVKDIAADLKKAADPKQTGLDALKDATDQFEKWDPTKGSAAVHGQETAKLAAKRAREAEARREKIAAIEDGAERLASEAKSVKETTTKTTAKAKPRKPAAKKAAAKKAPAKKTATKKAAPAKPASTGKSDT